MRKYLHTILFMCGSLFSLAMSAQQITTQEAKTMYTNKPLPRVSVHDPSIVWEPQSKMFYLFGTHRGQVKSADLQNWTYFLAPWNVIDSNTGKVRAAANNNEPFVTHRVTTVDVGGRQVTFGNYDALSWTRAFDPNRSLDGNMWAPDVIYNKDMKKWCMYLSLDGGWGANNCVIVLLTADNIEGPYLYEGPVVYTGFFSNTDARISYKKTDLELVIGTQNALPYRYEWDPGATWPNGIDPCVFYDDEGNLLMNYGSFFGGIWMLELDEKTGLRDYNVQYGSDFEARHTAVTRDPYFGIKLAGGCGATGEGSYIEKIGRYYYLFVTHGALGADQGYDMRVFRSLKPQGPYVGPNGQPAVLDAWEDNVGIWGTRRGEKVMAPYCWGFMTLGEVAQGHNSIMAAPDGRTYLVYHTRFHDNGPGHQVRTHQVFLNKAGWLCVAPFEYTGETVTDEDIASSEMFSKQEIAGTYKMLINKYDLDFANLEEVQPITVNLTANGRVTGDKTGTWTLIGGTSYVSISFDNSNFGGVIIEQQMEPTTIKALCFTACNAQGLTIWGYKMREDYALAYTLNNNTMPVKDGQNVASNLKLNSWELPDNVKLTWTSSRPDVIDENGRINPYELEEDVDVQLIPLLKSGTYYWTDTINVKAIATEMPEGDVASGAKAFYNFNSAVYANAYNASEKATKSKLGTGVLPAMESDAEREGKFLRTFFGIHDNNSILSCPNPLKGADLSQGVTFSFWVKMNGENLWDALCSFYNSTTKETLFLTGNGYLGYAKDNANKFDINHPESGATNYILANQWKLLTVTISPDEGISLYVSGLKKRAKTFSGTLDGQRVERPENYNYEKVLSHIASCDNFYIGHGSPWGSSDACFDDLMIYARALSSADVMALYRLECVDFDLASLTTGIETVEVQAWTDWKKADNDAIYDINGRLVRSYQGPLGPSLSSLRPGVYISHGKKFYVK